MRMRAQAASSRSQPARRPVNGAPSEAADGRRAAADAISRYGLYGAIGIGVVLLVGFAGFRLWRRRAMNET